MTREYEATIALNTMGREDSVDELIRDVESVFRDNGAEVTEIQKLDRRELAYQPQRHKVTHGYYVVYLFSADPANIAELRRGLKHHEDVILSYFQLIGETAGTA